MSCTHKKYNNNTSESPVKVLIDDSHVLVDGGRGKYVLSIRWPRQDKSTTFQWTRKLMTHTWSPGEGKGVYYYAISLQSSGMYWIGGRCQSEEGSVGVLETCNNNHARECELLEDGPRSEVDD